MFHVCMLLSGCGMYDGTEPQEAVAFMAAVERRRGRILCAAPRGELLHVVDHLDGNEMEGSRNVWQEAARLSRGKIQRLEDARGADALAVAGGYGVAKNLMTGFADASERRDVLPEVRSLLEHFLEAGKPLVFLSLGKILLEALVDDPFTERLRREDPGELYEDPERPLLYTPGFLVGDRLGQILPGLDAAAERVLELCQGEDG